MTLTFQSVFTDLDRCLSGRLSTRQREMRHQSMSRFDVVARSTTECARRLATRLIVRACRSLPSGCAARDEHRPERGTRAARASVARRRLNSGADRSWERRETGTAIDVCELSSRGTLDGAEVGLFELVIGFFQHGLQAELAAARSRDIDRACSEAASTLADRGIDKHKRWDRRWHRSRSTVEAEAADRDNKRLTASSNIADRTANISHDPRRSCGRRQRPRHRTQTLMNPIRARHGKSPTRTSVAHPGRPNSCRISHSCMTDARSPRTKTMRVAPFFDAGIKARSGRAPSA